jgi:hypothetical protein
MVPAPPQGPPLKFQGRVPYEVEDKVDDWGLQASQQVCCSAVIALFGLGMVRGSLAQHCSPLLPER